MNYELRITNCQKGFTLIELLASTVVIVTVGALVIAIIVTSLRGTNKTNTISTARQNGTHAIAQISKMLRFARSVDAIDDASPSVCIIGITPTPQSQLTGYNSITFTSIDGGVTTIACEKISDPDNPDGPETIASNGASLLDTAVVQIPSGLCQITCNQSTISDALSVGINFSLETTRSTGQQLLPEFNASSSAIEFNTSLILRNAGR